MTEKNSGGSSQLSQNRFASNTVIFEEGDKGDAAYIIRLGEVEIRKGGSQRQSNAIGRIGERRCVGGDGLVR